MHNQPNLVQQLNQVLNCENIFSKECIQVSKVVGQGNVWVL